MTTPRISAIQEPVGIPRRLGALFYDALLLLAILFLATALALAVTKGDLDNRGLGYRLYLLAIMFGFYGWFWTHGGQTLGMRTWRIRVERLDGSPLRWWHALARLVIALLTLGLGLLWTAWDSDRRALYDWLTGTRVVRT